MPRGFNIGDRVRLREGITDPTYGFGYGWEKQEDIGVVMSLGEYDRALTLRVLFRDGVWVLCIPSEMEVVGESTTESPDGQISCDDCGELFNKEDFTPNLPGICPDCATEYDECDDCGEYYYRSESTLGDRCDNCSENYFRCNSCGDVYHNDDYDGDGSCTSCSEDREGIPIRGYHCPPDLIFHPSRGLPIYFGVELETDNYQELQESAEALSLVDPSEDLFYLCEDGSLGYGFEIISHPCTLKFHQEEFPWRKIIETIKDNGGKSEDTQTCALHVHFSSSFFSKKPNLYRVKLVYLFEKFRAEIASFGRTSSYLLDRSAKKYERTPGSVFNKTAVLKVYEYETRYSRLQAVNLQSTQKTIEIRIFRGTLRVSDVIGSIELVDILARLVKVTSIKELQALRWKDIIKLASNKKYHFVHAILLDREENPRPLREESEEDSTDTLILSFVEAPA